MSIIDALMSPAIKTALSTYSVSTQTVGGAAKVADLGVNRNIGLISKPYGPGWDINIRSGTSGGAATAQLTLVTDDNTALSSPATLYTGPVYTLAQTVKTDLFLPVPDTDLWERYLAWRITVGTAVFTGGTLSIEYVADRRAWRGYLAQGNR
jgi:hypothetical protein